MNTSKIIRGIVNSRGYTITGHVRRERERTAQGPDSKNSSEGIAGSMEQKDT